MQKPMPSSFVVSVSTDHHETKKNEAGVAVGMLRMHAAVRSNTSACSHCSAYGSLDLLGLVLSQSNGNELTCRLERYSNKEVGNECHDFVTECGLYASCLPLKRRCLVFVARNAARFRVLSLAFNVPSAFVAFLCLHTCSSLSSSLFFDLLQSFDRDKTHEAVCLAIGRLPA